MNIQLPGRKATIAGGVVTTLLVFIGNEMFEGTILIVALAMIGIITVAYTYFNVLQKSVLPVEMNPPDTTDKMDVSISNIHAELKNLNERVNGITNRIPPKTGAVDIVPK